MKLDLKFKENMQRLDLNFGQFQYLTDGGYERGYAEGYKNGYADAMSNINPNPNYMFIKDASGLYLKTADGYYLAVQNV